MFSTTTTKKSKIKCWYCHKYFNPGRSLTTHLNACSKKRANLHLPCSNVQLQQHSFVSEQEDQTLQLQQLFHDNESEQKNQ